MSPIITRMPKAIKCRDGFDVRDVLNRTWLATAMEDLVARVLVPVRLTRQEADRLMTDWYYGYATYAVADGEIVMTFGDERA